MKRGDIMETYNYLEESYGNYITSAELNKENITRTELNALLDNNYLKKASRGLYYFDDNYKNLEIYEVNKFEKNAILNLYSAIFYHNLSSHIIKNWDVAIINNRRPSKAAESKNIKYHYVKPELFNIGLMEFRINKNDIRIYDKERTICDVIKYRNIIDPYIYGEVIRNYFNSKNKNISNLKNYGELLKVNSIVNMYMEVFYGI